MAYKIEPLEEYIEADICEYLALKGATVSKIISEGFYDKNKEMYRKRKSAFSSPGISDIIGCYEGYYFAIEVKTPSEMEKADKSIEELTADYIDAQRRNLSGATIKKYQHRVEQRAFLDGVERSGGIACFASSIQDVKEAFARSHIIL